MQKNDSYFLSYEKNYVTIILFHITSMYKWPSHPLNALSQQPIGM